MSKKQSKKKPATKKTTRRTPAAPARSAPRGKVPGAEAGERLKHNQFLIAQCESIPKAERLAMMESLAVTCSGCSVDVGEFCRKAKGSGITGDWNGKKMIIHAADVSCAIRIEQASKATALIDSELAKRGMTRSDPKAKPGRMFPGDERAIAPGVGVFVRWPPGPPKLGILIKMTAAGEPMVRIARVDAKGFLTGDMGTPRTFPANDIMLAVPHTEVIDTIAAPTLAPDMTATATAAEKTRRKVEKQGEKALAHATGNAPAPKRGSPLDRAVATAAREGSLRAGENPDVDETMRDLGLATGTEDAEERLRLAAIDVRRCNEVIETLQYGVEPGVVTDAMRADLGRAVKELSEARMAVHSQRTDEQVDAGAAERGDSNGAESKGKTKRKSKMPPAFATQYAGELPAIVHLLKTRGGVECGSSGHADVDINLVTCDDCRRLHDAIVVEPVDDDAMPWDDEPFVAPVVEATPAKEERPKKERAKKAKEPAVEPPRPAARTASEIETENRDAAEMLAKHSPPSPPERPVNLDAYATKHEGGETIRQRELREKKEARFKPAPPPGSGVPAHHPSRIEDETRRREDAFARARAPAEPRKGIHRPDARCVIEDCDATFETHWSDKATSIINPPAGWWSHEEDGGNLRVHFCPKHRVEGEEVTKVYADKVQRAEDDDLNEPAPADVDDAVDEDGKMPWE